MSVAVRDVALVGGPPGSDLHYDAASARWYADIPVPAAAAAGDLQVVYHLNQRPTLDTNGWATIITSSIGSTVYYGELGATARRVQAGEPGTTVRLWASSGSFNRVYVVTYYGTVGGRVELETAAIWPSQVDYGDAGPSLVVKPALDFARDVGLLVSFAAETSGGFPFNNAPTDFGYAVLASQSDWPLAVATRAYTGETHEDASSGLSGFPLRYWQTGSVQPGGSILHNLWENLAPPAPELIAPNGGETWNAGHNVLWNAPADDFTPPSGLRYQVQLSTNGGTDWADLVALTAPGAVGLSYDFTDVPATTTARIRVRAFDGFSYGPWDESSANFEIRHNKIPLTPTWLFPANGSTVDLSIGYPFDWISNDDGPQAAWALRRRLLPPAPAAPGAYEWWDATTGTWGSTEHFNLGATEGYDFPAGKWPTSGRYGISLRTRDSLLEVSPYTTDAVVTLGVAAHLAVLSPVGSIASTNRPVVSWVRSHPTGLPQTKFDVRIFTATAAAGDTFDPELDPPTAESGPVSSAVATSWQSNVALTNHGAYVVYVRSATAGDLWSPWATAAFSLSLTPPPPPTLAAASEPAEGRVRLELTPAPDGSLFTRANTILLVERSDDAGATWEAIRGGENLTPPPAGPLVLHDWEAPLGRVATYRATSSAIVEGGTLESAPSAARTVTYLPDDGWLKDPFDPTRNARLDCLAGVTLTRSREGQAITGLGRKFPIVQSGVRRARTATLTVTPLTPGDAAALEVLLDEPGAVLRLEDPEPAEGWASRVVYAVVVGDDVDAPTAPGLPYRDLTIPITEVRPPAASTSGPRAGDDAGGTFTAVFTETF